MTMPLCLNIMEGKPLRPQLSGFTSKVHDSSSAALKPNFYATFLSRKWEYRKKEQFQVCDSVPPSK